MKNEDALKAIEEMEKSSKKRKFEQKIDLIINLRNLDPKKPDGQIDISTMLPFATGSTELKSVLFAKTNSFASLSKPVVQKVIMADQIPGMKKTDIQELLGFDALFAEGDAMLLVGRYLGQDLAPKGKMPKPVTGESVEQIKSMLAGMKGKIRATNKKGKGIPTIQLTIGKESMKTDQIAENILHIYREIEKTLPKKKLNIKSVMVKKTMGPVQKMNF